MSRVEIALAGHLAYPAPMQDVDVGSIVPSTRDLLQAISTRRKNLALLAAVGADEPAGEAARLAELNVSALAHAEAGPSMALAARATKTVPSLGLLAVASREHVLAARKHGADGVCIDAAMSVDAWNDLARTARTMRMLPLALARDAVGVEAAEKAGARAVVLRAATAAEVLELAARAARGVTLVAHVEGADAAAIRALAGKVDAAVVPASVHAGAAFAELVAEVDP